MAVKKYESELLGVVIEVDQEKCEGIGACVDACPVEVYELVDGKPVPKDIDNCIECCVCVDSCPKGAIKHSSC